MCVIREKPFLFNVLIVYFVCLCFLQFFIKDTKSSNGTFVNETRLSSSGEESAPRELRSKDLVQFGVNVNVDKKGLYYKKLT